MVISNPTIEMLTEAQNAYHSLVTGTSARVIVDMNGERVEFVTANRFVLANYIQQLQIALGLCTPDPLNPPGGPLGFTF